MDEDIQVTPELSQDFTMLDEFCNENSGQELGYLEVVVKNPLDMDAVTIAFSMRHLVRLSKDLTETLLQSLTDDSVPTLGSILASKGIQLDKTHSDELRGIIFTFRDSADEETSAILVKAFQLIAMIRNKRRLNLNLAESYSPPEDGWTEEDLGDASALEAVRSIEDPRWINSEDM